MPNNNNNNKYLHRKRSCRRPRENCPNGQRIIPEIHAKLKLFLQSTGQSVKLHTTQHLAESFQTQGLCDTATLAFGQRLLCMYLRKS